ncbi:nucleotidyl cyclase domain-containing protein [Nitrosopumilus sp. S6]
MDFTASLRLIHANFFFVDIVGLSDTSMSTKTQIKKIETLNKCISECQSFQSVPKESLLLLPTGDGCCIGFLQGPELPLLVAVELHQKLAAYNKAKIPSETVRVRIGLHSGNCFLVNDLLGQRNTWGPGIIYARRVMDFGDDGHILLSPTLAEDLRSLSDEYRDIIKPVHDVVLKHGTTMLLYSAYGEGFGNKKHPEKGASVRSKYGEEILRLQKTTLYPSIDLVLTVQDPEKMIVQHKRTYEVANISNEPIKNVLHGIAFDVDIPDFNDLNIKVYDEKNRECKITSINVDKPDTKEFTTEFSEPIIKDDKGKKYTLEYEVPEPERYFENAFLIDCQKFNMSFHYPLDKGIKRPELLEINQETEESTPSKVTPKITKDGNIEKVKWEITEIPKGRTFRIDW